MKIRRMALLLIMMFLISACSNQTDSPAIVVTDAWVRPVVVGSAVETSTSSHSMDSTLLQSTPDSLPDGVAEQPTMETDTGVNSAVYFMILNNGSVQDRLLGVSSPVAKEVGIHQTSHDGDMAKMAPIIEVKIPPKTTVEFRPGGYHVMLQGVKQDLRVGESINLTLVFEISGEIPIQAIVKAN